jgi:serine/threonine protein kinase
MEADRWRRVEQIFQQALDATADERDAIVRRSCGGDASLRREVESLLEHYADADSFLETPAFLSTRHAAGTTIGQYRILEEIGGGGMGVVYKAEDTKLARVVALKFLNGRRASTTGALEQFRSEARAASSLNHPNVCVIYDIEEVEGEQFIAMEFIEGRTLAELTAGQPLAIDTIATLGSQIADALAVAHQKGIVHRDIQPANIIVTPTGLVKVLDFGLATLLHADLSGIASASSPDTKPIAGTLPYMSPELLQGAHVDDLTDVFALGTVLYEMATGQRPFAGASVADTIDQILNRQPIPPAQLNGRVPVRLARIIQTCLEKDPARRYARADAVAGELRGLLSRDNGHRQRRTLALMFAAVATAAIGGLSATWWSTNRGSDLPRSAPWEQLTDFPDSATSPALSRDGRMVAFIRGSSTFVGPGDIYIKTLPDGDPLPLTSDGGGKQDPLFSPDASRIVYTTGPLPYDVWSVPVSGGTPQMMMRNASGLTWTGDGRVMFGEVRGALHMAIVSADVNRGAVRDVYVPSRMSEMAHRAFLSPDRNWVLVAEMDTAGQGWLPCRLVPADGSAMGAPIGPSGAPCTSAAWSPDGKWMYMSSAAGGSYHIWRQQFPRGAPEQVTFGPTQEEGIAMAPDGRSLITSVGTAQSTLSLVTANGERKIDSEATVTMPRFTNDGRTLFYLMQRQLRDLDRQSGELWAVDVASGKRERVLPGLRIVSYAISPNGARIAATALDEGGRSQIWLAPADRQAPPTRVDWPTRVAVVLFDPAGGLFLLASEGASDFVYHTDVNGQNGRRIIAAPVINILEASPSGQWLLVRAQLPGRDASSVGVVAYPVNGGNPVSVFDTMWPVAQWASDGKQFYVRLRDGAAKTLSLVLLPVSAGNELPALPAGGLTSPAQAARLPGAKVVATQVPADADVVAAAITADFSVAAIVRTAVHRNLYRVPLP